LKISLFLLHLNLGVCHCHWFCTCPQVEIVVPNSQCSWEKQL